MLGGCGRTSGAVISPTAPVPREEAAPALDHATETPVISDFGQLRPFFVAGETITWKVTFLGIEGGRARMAVGTPGLVDGRLLLSVHAEGEASGLLTAVRRVHDEIRSWVSVESGIPARTESDSEFQGKRLQVTTVREQGTPLADLTAARNNGPPTRRRQRLPDAGTHDPLSALLVLRSWKAPPGACGTFHALAGTRLWHADVKVEGRERVLTPLGGRLAVRVRGISTRLTATLEADRTRKPRIFRAWITDDDQRIPVRIKADTEFGPVDVRVTSYQSQ